MNPRKQLWILVGGNGSGKTTFYETRLKSSGIPFINADLIAKELFPDSPEQHSYDAAAIAQHKRENLLLEGRSFCFETVFSHPSKIDFLAKAKALGYEVNMVFIHLVENQLNLARVNQRVSNGGHDVPATKIIERIPRLVAHVKKAIPLCDQVLILDNSSAANPFEIVAVIKNQSIEILNRKPWLKTIIDESN